MSTLEMLWFRLIPLTSWMATAAVVVQTLIWIVRPTSPQTHRIAWACVLVSGIVFARIRINIPDHRLDPIAARQLKAIVETMPDSLPRSRDPHSDPRASVPGVSSARLSPDAGDRVRASHVGVRIESEVSVSPPAILLARLLQLTGRQFALLAWGLGTAVLLGMGSLSYIRFARRATRFEPASGEWAREWHDLCCERRCEREIPIVISESYGPALCLVPAGYCLVVPKTLWMSLSPAERTGILRHELAHYERNDLFKSLFARLVVALHWFNPAAWWARRQFEAAGEWACDDQAARRCGSVAFARTLIQLAGIRFPSIPLTDSIGAGALYSRIRRLLIASSIVDARWKRSFIAAVSVGVVALVSVRVSLVAEATSPPTIPIIASNETESPAPSKANTQPPSTSTPNTGLPQVDQFGDPLPRGAVLRLGTMRLRHYGVEQTAFSPDGKTIVSMAWTGTFGLWDRKTGRLIRMLQDSVGDYALGRTFALSPDGGKLVSVGRFIRKKVANGYVCLWDLTTGKKLWSATVDGREDFESVAFSPDGTLVAAGRAPFTFFEVATGKELRRCGDAKTRSPKSSLELRRSGSGPIVFSPDCRTLITLERAEGRKPDRERGGHIRLWDVQTGNRSGSIPSDDFQIVSLFTSLDGNQIIAGGFRNIPAAQFPGPIVTLNALVPEIRYWDLKTGKLVRTLHLDEPTTGNGAISLSKDQTKIAWSVDGAVWMWDAVAGKPLKQFPGLFGPVSISCSPDGAAFAVGCAHVIEILETATGRRLPTDLGPFVNSLNAVKFSPDGRTIYTGAGDNGDLTAWDATTGAIRFQKTHGPLPSISSLDVSTDGQWIATCGMKERLSNGVNLHVATLWDAHTGEPVRDFYDHERPLWTQRVAISPDSRLLAVAGKRLGNEVVTEIWDVKSGKRIAEVRPAGEWEMWPICMRFSSDSKSLFTLNATSYARRWNTITGALEKEFFAAETPSNPQSIHWISGAAIAPDYRTIVSSEKRSLHTWNLGSGDLVSVIEMPEPGKQRSFNELAISGDGRLLAAVEIVNSPDANGGGHHNGSSVIRIYDRTTGRELQNLDTGNRNATGLDFSSYGNRLASVMSDGTALVWDLSLAQRRLHQ